MNNMLIFLLSILVVLIFSWIFQGLRLYRSCKGDIYSTLYGGFIHYFYRYVVLRDCSESGFLHTLLGTHRIVFSTVNIENKQRVRFCVIFYNQGIMVLCYDRMTGVFQGKASDKSWKVLRVDEDGKQHVYRYHNPIGEFRGYLSRIAALFPDVPIEARLALPDGCDFSQLSSDVKVIRFGELENELTGVHAVHVSDEGIKAMYSKLMGK